jgi:hypothetical protein
MSRNVRRYPSQTAQSAKASHLLSASTPASDSSRFITHVVARLRGANSLLAALAVIGMATFGFYTLSAARGPAQLASTSSASSAPLGKWTTTASLAATSAPIFAPSNPNVIYQISTPSLRRSTDSGKTWKFHALPERLASGLSLYVSPLSANTLFLSARYLSPPQDGARCIETPESLPPAAGYDCVAQWVSRDGGAHWLTPRLPLGAPLADLAPPFWSGAPEFVQAQGHILFGALYCHKPLCGNTGYRIVRSSDGGVSWQFTDTDIAAGHHYVCDFAPVTDGATIFAVSADISCATALAGMSPNGVTPLTLWRSDNAGKRWSQVAILPAAVGGHLLVEPSPESAQPLMYSNSYASVDGGITWRPAPQTGLPAGAHAEMLGVRHDGSLLLGAIPMNIAAGQPVTEMIYRWRAGDSSWRQVGAPLPSFARSVTVTANARGRETLYLTLPIGPFSTIGGGQSPMPASYQIASLPD